MEGQGAADARRQAVTSGQVNHQRTPPKPACVGNTETNTETAQVLGLRESAASKRYTRALRSLQEILAGMPGGAEG